MSKDVHCRNHRAAWESHNHMAYAALLSPALNLTQCQASGHHCFVEDPAQHPWMGTKRPLSQC